MESASIAPTSPAQRAKVSNGAGRLAGVSGRSTEARRFRDIVADLTEELGGFLSPAETLQVRAAASLQLHVEDLTAKMVRGEPVDPEEVTRAGNSAIRALQSIRRRKETKRPKTSGGAAAYLAAKREEAAA